MFDGHCSDSSDDGMPRGHISIAENVFECEERCIMKNADCTAFSFKSTTRKCRLFKNGPYTKGDGTKDVKCYTINQGILLVITPVWVNLLI